MRLSLPFSMWTENHPSLLNEARPRRKKYSLSHWLTIVTHTVVSNFMKPVSSLTVALKTNFRIGRAKILEIWVPIMQSWCRHYLGTIKKLHYWCRFEYSAADIWWASLALRNLMMVHFQQHSSHGVFYCWQNKGLLSGI